jgi:soluble lytic murein transglycosylase-like protein
LPVDRGAAAPRPGRGRGRRAGQVARAAAGIAVAAALASRGRVGPPGWSQTALPRIRRALLLACLLSLGLPGPATPPRAAPLPGAPAAPAGDACRAAIAQAEREAGLPPRLLAAIGRVESGRRDPATGRIGPWPWTINAEGRGSFFPDRAAAIAAVQALQAQGVRSIDIGCLQINLRHHPQAFATLDAAFDPLTNARYAARFLTELQASRGDWLQAAAHYHSQTPELAAAYRARVAAAWEEERGVADLPARGAGLLASGPARSLPGDAVAGGTSGAPRGRGLSAYRAQPIPVVGGGAPQAAVGLGGAPARMPRPRMAAGAPVLAPPTAMLAAPATGAPRRLDLFVTTRPAARPAPGRS